MLAPKADRKTDQSSLCLLTRYMYIMSWYTVPVYWPHLSLQQAPWCELAILLQNLVVPATSPTNSNQFELDKSLWLIPQNGLCKLFVQGLYRSWKTWKVMEFKWRSWKVMEKHFASLAKRYFKHRHAKRARVIFCDRSICNTVYSNDLVKCTVWSTYDVTSVMVRQLNSKP